MKLVYGMTTEPAICLVEFSLMSSNKSELETSVIGTSICLNSALLSRVALLFPKNPSKGLSLRIFVPYTKASRIRSDANTTNRQDFELLDFITITD
jgi:hypothetical protein